MMLRNLWKHLTGTHRPRPGNRPTYHRPLGLGLECLEDRRLLAVTALSIEPYLQDPTDTSMVIMWETQQDSTDNEVLYRVAGSGSAFSSATTDLSSDSRIAEIKLSGLSADSSYEYRVRSKAAGYDDGYSPSAIATYAFSTFPSTTPDEFRFAVYGDSRLNPVATNETTAEYHTAMVRSIIQSEPEFVIHVGDLANIGKTRSEWGPQLFVPAHDLMNNTPLFPVMGNHEYYPDLGNTETFADEYFSLPNNERWYAFTYGNVRFVVLDSTFEEEYENNPEPEQDGPEFVWLTEEMGSTAYTDAEWQIVFVHEPPYSSVGPNGFVKSYLVDTFRDNGVDMVFSGHAHFYERYEYQKYGQTTDPKIQYVVTGGGGSQLHGLGGEPADADVTRAEKLKAFHHTILDVDVPGKSLTLTAVDVNGETFDTVTLTLDGPRGVAAEAPPRAELISPGDGLAGDFDRDPKQLLVDTAPTSFVIELLDSDGIDDDSVDTNPNGNVESVTRDGVPISRSASTYTFNYNRTTDQITLSAPAGESFDTGVYQITLSGDDAKIEDEQQCEMLPTVLTVTVEPSYAWVDLVAQGSVWDYLVTDAEPAPDAQGNTWRDPLFVYSWPSGPAQLGYGDGDEATVIGYGDNGVNNKNITTYFRHTFNVKEKNNYLDSLSLSVVRDDGAVVYLNGTEVQRYNMPTGPITWNTLASDGVGGTEESKWQEPLGLDPSLLVDGTNTLAVEIHQYAPGSSDISFNLELKAVGSKLTHSFVSNVLEVYGTTLDDSIGLAVDGSDHVTLNGQVLSPTIDVGDVTELKVYGYSGDDTIELPEGTDLQNAAVSIFGGEGDDGLDVLSDTTVDSLTVDNTSLRVDVATTLTIEDDLTLQNAAEYAPQLGVDREPTPETLIGGMVSLSGNPALAGKLWPQRSWNENPDPPPLSVVEEYNVYYFGGYTVQIIDGAYTDTFDTTPSPTTTTAGGDHLGRGVFLTDMFAEANGGHDQAVAYETGEVHLDLFQAMAGDTDGNRKIEGPDILRILTASLFGDGVSPLANWTTGDFDGNHKVEGPDILRLTSSGWFGDGEYWTGEAPALTAPPGEAAQGGGSALAASSTVELFLAPQGLVIDAHDVPINAYMIESELGIFTGHQARNLGMFREDTDRQISGGFDYVLTGKHLLGKVIGDEFGAVDLGTDLTLSYTIEGQTGIYTATIGTVSAETLAWLADYDAADDESTFSHGVDPDAADRLLAMAV